MALLATPAGAQQLAAPLGAAPAGESIYLYGRLPSASAAERDTRCLLGDLRRRGLPARIVIAAAGSARSRVA